MRAPRPIGDRGDEDERPLWARDVSLHFGLSWRAAKGQLRREAEERKRIYDQFRARSEAPAPQIENGVRQWASPALLKSLAQKA